MKDTEFRRVPKWGIDALRTAVGTASVRRGIARAQAESGTLLLQFLYREKRALATVIQYPVRDVQDAYDKAALEFSPREHICYFIFATADALRRAESGGVPYMRAFTEVPGAVLRVPASLWTEEADAR